MKTFFIICHAFIAAGIPTDVKRYLIVVDDTTERLGDVSSDLLDNLGI